ncbi:winged helix-turn-helix transcriptional regulator [uncultured Sphingomonas sp.]|uniref:winged helix-turn-helix transcriptional regulator n=1 Tax=uncultured Sphingomonas sp. TaxID=158754 RepID=UPI0035CB86D4
MTQKALTRHLRRPECNGLVSRRVIPVSPIAVKYEITDLGRSLQGPFKALYAGRCITSPPSGSHGQASMSGAAA